MSQAGDILQIVIPLGSFGVSYYKDDHEGEAEFLKSYATTIASSYALKYSLRNSSWGTRPDGGKYSFPSGHTASAFSGAFYLQKRYGYAYGAPAIVLASFTAYSRIASEKHHWRDIIGGVSLAAVSNYFFVNSFSEQTVKISSDINKDSIVLNIGYNF